MPYEITLENVPSGVAVSSARQGENLTVALREFSSSEDGDIFVQRLEGLPSQLLTRIPGPRISPSKIDHMLILIRKDKTASVYINELSLLVTARLKRDKKEGDAVSSDDIVNIKSLDLNNVSIPADAGLMFLFSVGWRKGLFFDFACLNPQAKPRDYDVQAVLGHYFGYLTYQERYKVAEVEWEQLFDQQWFLFVSLNDATIRQILNYVRNQWEIDDLLSVIAAEVSSAIPEMLSRWNGNSILGPQMEFLTRAAERYIEKDFVSATSILYPRIEGILRNVHSVSGRNK